MNPVIKQLILKRFRSIPSERVDFDNPTFLVGQNGSGKSNLVDAFSFLADAMASPLQAVFDKRGGHRRGPEPYVGPELPAEPGLGRRVRRSERRMSPVPATRLRSGRCRITVSKVVHEQCLIEGAAARDTGSSARRTSFAPTYRDWGRHLTRQPLPCPGRWRGAIRAGPQDLVVHASLFH